MDVRKFKHMASNWEHDGGMAKRLYTIAELQYNKKNSNELKEGELNLGVWGKLSLSGEDARAL